MKYRHYNPNPFASRVGDCAVRACAKALNQSWQTTYIGIALEGFCLGDMPSANWVWGSYLQRHGFSRHTPPCADCYSVEQFAIDHTKGTYVLGLNGHTVCVHDGLYYDSWDSGNEIISYYWEKE